ncbi:DNA polymerase III subunit beta [Zafaria sp. J156]|uniref:DNA polymerase III subunit beta n=1 Tax=Zafaria sp. J156 TaxID=3116490 RepID=UPI002E7A9E19|nr:DNA polymerase III subunit beta [Zafaria sp. J156]MEE1621496.1 DNA polymerase III subunit beta [Zafaria sp. J156]
MKFSVERDVLAEAVSWTARSLSQRPPSPVLSGILITAGNGIVALAGFDYEISARIEIPADTTEEGSVLVSGKLLAEISRSLPQARVTIETEGSKVTVSCGRSRFHLATMPVGDYPELPVLPELAGVVDGEAFAQAVSQVIVAASKDDTLPILTGVKMEIEDDLITFLATDRYRLAMREVSWKPTVPGLSTSALVKARTLNEVAKTLGGSGELRIALGEDSDLIGFESGNRRTTSLLVDGDYPKIRSLFPESTPIHATVNTSELVEAVRRVAVVAERNTPVRLAFTDGQLALDAGTGEDAQAEEALETHLDGEEITVAFNPAYLSEGLNAFDSEFVRFSFTSAPKPAMMTAQKTIDGEDEVDYRYLVMPVRLPTGA